MSWREPQNDHVAKEMLRVGWLELVDTCPEDHREDLFTDTRQDAEARLVVAIEHGEQGNYRVAINRLSSFLGPLHGGDRYGRVQGGYRSGNIEAAAPELARLAAHYLIRFIVLRAQQTSFLTDDDAVMGAAAYQYIKKSKDKGDRNRMWEMLREVGAGAWCYKDKK